MMGGVLYNDVDPKTCRWVEELIRRELIAPGEVWCRDIRDIRPDEISEFTQFHAFCGVAVWSYALRLAGWPDERPVWTGSCPCNSFSSAGRRKGFADERHLWPAWFHLIGQCRPPVLFGEQVASSDAKPWLDLVHTDLEALGYAVGPIVLPAAGFGAVHGRHRIFLVAEPGGVGRDAGEQLGPVGERHQSGRGGTGDGGLAGGLADAIGDGGRCGGPGTAGATPGRVQGTDGQRQRVRPHAGSGVGPVDGDGYPGPANGFWRDADWLRCRDGRWRATQPGIFPLVTGTSARVVRGGDSGPSVDATAEARAMRLKGYGNAINAEVARHFIRAYMDAESGATDGVSGVPLV